jgi:hypothetical protein
LSNVLVSDGGSVDHSTLLGTITED